LSLDEELCERKEECIERKRRGNVLDDEEKRGTSGRIVMSSNSSKL